MKSEKKKKKKKKKSNPKTTKTGFMVGTVTIYFFRTYTNA